MKFIDLNQKAARYNGRDYINADSIEYNGETIYHLVADNDDLYCYLKANDVGYRTSLVPISDENILKNAIGIFTPPIMTAQVSNIAKDESMRAYQDNTNGDTNIKYFNEKAISDEKKELIMKFAAENFAVLQQKGYQFNLEKVLSKIKSTSFTEATLDSDSLGFYIEEDREVVLDRNLLDNLDDEDKKRALLRQLCFAIAGNDYTSKIFSNDNKIYSMVDGKINKICEDAFTTGEVSTEKVLKNLNDVEEGKIEYGFSEFVRNPEAMAIINQIEYLTGMKAGNDIFDGKNNIDTKFIDMYGKRTYNYLTARMNRLTSESMTTTIADYDKLIGKEYAEYFEDTQDGLLCDVFNTELEKIIKIDKKVDYEDAAKFFEKLKGFKQSRGQVVYFERDKEVHDRLYDFYFASALDRVCREIAKVDKEDADKLYDQYHKAARDQQEVDEINDQFKLLITDDVTQTEVDEISRTLNRDAKNNSKIVVVEHEKA